MFMDEPASEAGGLPTQAVAVEDVTKRYTRRVALEKLSLSVRAGEVFGLVGANGGGKTTALRILAGILRPEQGHGQVLGFDLLRGTREIRQHVGYMSQRFSLYTDLSVFENLRFRAEVYGLERPRAAAEIAIYDFGLCECAHSAAGQLSGGWARRLQLAAALIHSPRLILLDEPTAGLDAVSRQEVWRRIEHLAVQKAGVVVSTHDLAEAERSTHAALLSEGRVVAAGTPEQIARSAPAAAFLMSGGNARLLAECVETVPGVIASYPQGLSLRIVADVRGEEGLHRIASMQHVSLANTSMRLEDAVLAFSARPSKG
jgi:ABC-type multidrug transport system ATPase subunit